MGRTILERIMIDQGEGKGIVIRLLHGDVASGGAIVRLSQKEFALLALLVTSAHQSMLVRSSKNSGRRRGRRMHAAPWICTSHDCTNDSSEPI